MEKLKIKKQISKKEGYFKCLYNDIISSLRDTKKIILVVALYDFLFYVFLYLGSKLLTIMTNRQLERIQPMLGEMMTTITTDLAQLENNLAVMKGFQNFLIIAPIIFLLFVIIDWTIFKGIIWVNILKKRFDLKYFKNFLALNLLWFIPWAILLVLVIVLVRQNASAYIVLFLFVLLMHMSGVLCIAFAKENKIINSIKQAFSIGIGKIHLFLVPYTILIILFVVVSQLGWLFKLFSYNIQAILSLILFVLYLAFARVFLSKIVLRVR